MNKSIDIWSLSQNSIWNSFKFIQSLVLILEIPIQLFAIQFSLNFVSMFSQAD